MLSRLQQDEDACNVFLLYILQSGHLDTTSLGYRNLESLQISNGVQTEAVYSRMVE